MSYTVLARKYRPQRFEDLVGQEHVTRTLCNAIESGRVAHAFLLTGVRGVGKTTTARILAKALNCERGPTPSPCNQCAPCQEITAGVDMDVIEIDGASNNSVDDVRRLQETLPFSPARDRSKILIVDEVHMLSSSAFNALLKTLEEPPAHVKFILATTEAHKVPITIRSRCQRYDYRLIPSGTIAARIRDILKAEAISADDETIALVAREAAGSMRDALTLLDQILAFGGKELNHDSVAQALGIADRRVIFQLTQAVLNRQSTEALRMVDAMSQQGMDVMHTLRQLLCVMRDLVVLHTVENAEELTDMTDDELHIARTLVGSVSALELQRTYSMLSTLLDDVTHSASPRMDLEMGLLRITSAPPLRDMQTLLRELEQHPAVSRSGASQLPPSEPPKTKPATPISVAPVAVDAMPTTGPNGPVAEPGSPLSVAWEAVVSSLRASRPALAAVLEHGVIVKMDPKHVEIAFEKQSFYANQADHPQALAAIAQVAAEVMKLDANQLPKVGITRNAGDGESLIKRQDNQHKARQEQTRQKALAHPAVKKALEIFPEAADKIDVRIDVD
jgi:DNA polymerase-3 subunit gamma/tau